MSDYRRYYVPGGSYFFTPVTYLRRPLFSTAANVDRLRDACRTVRRAYGKKPGAKRALRRAGLSRFSDQSAQTMSFRFFRAVTRTFTEAGFAG